MKFLIPLFYLSTAAFAGKAPPVVILDKTLTAAETIEGVPLSAGDHVVVYQYQSKGKLQLPKTLEVTHPGGAVKIGAALFSKVHVSYGPVDLTTWALNIGNPKTHFNIVQPVGEYYSLNGTVAEDFDAAEIRLQAGGDVNTWLYTKDFRTLHVQGGRSAVSATLDGVEVFPGDAVVFQADGHIAAIRAQGIWDATWQRYEYKARAVDLRLHHNGALETARIFAHGVVFTRYHVPSIVQPTDGQRLFGLPLANADSLGDEAIEIFPGGAFNVTLAQNSDTVFEGIPVGSKETSYEPDLEFDAQGFLTKAALGGPIAYGGVLLKTGVYLDIDHGRIATARLRGNYARYAFDGKFGGRDRFVISAVLHFEDGRLVGLDGADATNENLIAEYRRDDRVVRPLN